MGPGVEIPAMRLGLSGKGRAFQGFRSLAYLVFIRFRGRGADRQTLNPEPWNQKLELRVQGPASFHQSGRVLPASIQCLCSTQGPRSMSESQTLLGQGMWNKVQ